MPVTVSCWPGVVNGGTPPSTPFPVGAVMGGRTAAGSVTVSVNDWLELSGRGLAAMIVNG